ncbi:hypothetical protein GCM10009548_05670 [Streptomyces malaysiensis subsp. malaysiensis]|uniref:AAA family ATPase n=1 Tax=Streptomyces malaysiensis TaxID=92644 RepID=A0ABX6W3E2_STRMQ|nr:MULTISPECIES: BTAD domain-containing putative transcriptional regulator [Streptomyces]QPI56025.1 AAA family ATPase [Streptomyces solisilvae]UHH17494.1 NB-ARC domain-containing protein [Streptomyces sp. HNM0561]
MQSNPPNHLCFKILGALEAWDGDRRLNLDGPVNERVLGLLLLESGWVVPIPRLVEAVWGEDPPSTATQQIRKAVARLRHQIPSGQEIILTERHGYRLVVDDDSLDLRLFDLWTHRAQTAHAEGRLKDAVADLTAALGLWRGSILVGAGGPLIDTLRPAWEERHIAAIEHCFDLRLDLGETSELIADLRESVVAHPFRETLMRQLMLALYRAGRQAEAVEEYARIRSLLAGELGIDPSPELTELHEAILRGEAWLTAGRDQKPPVEEPSIVAAPRSIPRDLADFTGRQDELRRLTTMARPVAEQTGPRIVVVEGMGGSGKTALAMHVAHRLAGDYPDGQLYLDLRGFASAEEPLSPERGLGDLLRALGAADECVADDDDCRLTRWRMTSAKRRILLILDDAWDVAQVRPLLPTAAGSLVLITSRVRLPELEGAEELSLAVLGEEDGVELMRRLLGHDRVAAEPKATARLVSLCGGLPLALRICAARLRKRPHWSVRHLTDRLEDDTHALRELESGDRSVAGVLRTSYRVMEPAHQDAFRLLTLHPGADFDVSAAAALLGTGPDSAERILEYLLDVNLLQQFEFGRYSFHGLVHSFARSLPAPNSAEETEAVARLAAQTVTRVESACDVLLTGQVRYRPAWSIGNGSASPPHGGPDHALRWLDRERSNILAIISQARQWGLSHHAAKLSRAMALCQQAQTPSADSVSPARPGRAAKGG